MSHQIPSNESSPQQHQQPVQPPQQQDAQQEPRQSLSVDDALNTLCPMFESVDRDVVQMILIEGCNGNMEAAVEALLNMTGGISPPPKSNKPKTSDNTKEILSKSMPKNIIRSKHHNKHKNRMHLPDDFLRPPSYYMNKLKLSQSQQSSSNNIKSKQQQIIDDEMFAKAIFEDSLFTADLHNNPEWVLEEINNKKNKKQLRKKNKKSNAIDNVSDIDQRKISFKQKVNSLGSSAKEKLAVLAHKLQRNKQQTKSKNINANNSHQYKNMLTSLDDDALLDVDDIGSKDVVIEVDANNTYQPPAQRVPQKPVQEL